MRILDLCQQPQPPATCDRDIKQATADVEVANQTLIAARRQLDTDIQAQAQANKALNDTRVVANQAHAKFTADTQKCIDDIAAKSDTKDAASEAYDEATQQCPGACPPPPPLSLSHGSAGGESHRRRQLLLL
jgi:multidrug efflux pump subunit AcrA (membrane-fusion protein)